MAPEMRSAAGIEGLLILGAIYFVLNLLSKAGKKAAQRGTLPPTDADDESSSTQDEAVSLEKILREIQRVKQEKDLPRPAQAQRQKTLPARKAAPPQRRAQPTGDDYRGPLGRHSRTRLPGAEEVEERTSLEGESLEVEESLEVIDDRPARRLRIEVDSDDRAEEVAQRRIREAEARNRPLNAADHRRFDAEIRPAARAAAAEPKKTAGRSRLKEALVWREILGPPKSLQE